jgi:hypothetical protein
MERIFDPGRFIRALPALCFRLCSLEYDISSGDITMGMIYELSIIGNDGRGGNIAMRGAGGPSTQIGVAQKDDSPEDGYQVSAAIEYGKWTVLGSPYDTGLVVCNTEL